MLALRDQLKCLGLEEEVQLLDDDVVDLMRSVEAEAEGAAGDSPKYEQAANLTRDRWTTFLEVSGNTVPAGEQPTIKTSQTKKQV